MSDTPYDPAERLPGGRLDPEDAPPGYAEVARVLGAAAGPPCPDELAGQPAALATFHRVRHRARVRARLVTVALAGTLAIGGLWIADGAHSPLGLLSPSGGPGSGGSGSGAPAGAPGSGGAGSAAPGSGGAAAGEGGGSPELPSTRERAIARSRWWRRLPGWRVGQRGPPGHVVQGRAGQGRAGQGQAGQGRGGREGRLGGREVAAGRLDAQDRAQVPDSLIIGSGGVHGGRWCGSALIDGGRRWWSR
jgi:hypothetical protein